MARALTPLPAGEEKSRVVRGLFDAIASRYDMVNRVMTFGMDRAWRRRAAGTLGLLHGATVLDIACGTGDFLREARSRQWNVIGVDFSGEMLRAAAARGETGLVQADALKLPLANASIDGITCGFALRNVSDLATLFDEMSRVLRTGGRFALLETSQPSNALLKLGHGIYFNRIVPLIGGVLSNREAYGYLPRSAAYLPDPLVIKIMLERSGFTDVHRITHIGGAVQTLIGTKA
ncbi:MAG: bifunctional demethylmenaquinone methyltransferase/2-methoxy-6-polyprenyl-1,4-benzoquinol methylase UbiE [Actinomycetota bacterium]